MLKKDSIEASCSSINEHKLAKEKLDTSSHAYFVAYKDDEFDYIATQSKTLTFNSLSQYKNNLQKLGRYSDCSFGLRINPEVDLVSYNMYNPCNPNSRLGVTKSVLDTFLINHDNNLPRYIDGFMVHALCEDKGIGLCKLLDMLEHQFGSQLEGLKWLNLGGGHLITASDYDYNRVIVRVNAFRSRFPNLRLYIEPSSAFAWQSGILATKIVDIVKGKECDTIIVDASFSCHIPDTLEMPYKPNVVLLSQMKDDISSNGILQWSGNIGGITCLAGDMVSDYSFDIQPHIGDIIIFEDMIHYTMVKTTFFNGVDHPDIMLKKTDGSIVLLRSFGYDDYKGKL